MSLWSMRVISSYCGLLSKSKISYSLLTSNHADARADTRMADDHDRSEPVRFATASWTDESSAEDRKPVAKAS